MLEALDGDRLRTLRCWFGGGTAIALRHGEYRESVGIDYVDVNGQVLLDKGELTAALPGQIIRGRLCQPARA